MEMEVAEGGVERQSECGRHVIRVRRWHEHVAFHRMQQVAGGVQRGQPIVGTWFQLHIASRPVADGVLRVQQIQHLNLCTQEPGDIRQFPR